VRLLDVFGGDEPARIEPVDAIALNVGVLRDLD
jgi:hypothetical protein